MKFDTHVAAQVRPPQDKQISPVQAPGDCGVGKSQGVAVIAQSVVIQLDEAVPIFSPKVPGVIDVGRERKVVAPPGTLTRKSQGGVEAPGSIPEIPRRPGTDHGVPEVLCSHDIKLIRPPQEVKLSGQRALIPCEVSRRRVSSGKIEKLQLSEAVGGNAHVHHVVANLVITLDIGGRKGIYEIHGVEEKPVPPCHGLAPDSQGTPLPLEAEKEAVEPVIEDIPVIFANGFRKIEKSPVVFNGGAGKKTNIEKAREKPIEGVCSPSPVPTGNNGFVVSCKISVF